MAKAKAAPEAPKENVVNVVETIAASPKEGWNKDIEVNNLQDADSRNLQSPRRAVNATYAHAKLNIVGTDTVPNSSENDAPAENGSVADHGLPLGGDKGSPAAVLVGGEEEEIKVA